MENGDRRVNTDEVEVEKGIYQVAGRINIKWLYVVCLFLPLDMFLGKKKLGRASMTCR
jgi:hypothetical protein